MVHFVGAIINRPRAANSRPYVDAGANGGRGRRALRVLLYVDDVGADVVKYHKNDWRWITMWQCPKCGREFKNTNQSHYCGKIETIDAYISDQPDEVRPILQKIRETIRAALPEATEKIAWSMPYFWQGENIISFAAHKKHISIYPGERAVSDFADRLTDYKTSKGTIQFPIEAPIDYGLIADLSRYCVSQVTQK